MYCPNCNHYWAAHAKVCFACGADLGEKQGQMERPEFYFPLESTNLLLVVLMSLLSAGLYYPFWFLGRRDAINSLYSREKMGMAVYFVLLTFLVFYLFLILSAGFMAELGATTMEENLHTLGGIVGLLVSLIMLFESFRIRRILYDHFRDYLKEDIEINGILLFFFQIFYLQYIINKLAKTGMTGGKTIQSSTPGHTNDSTKY